MTTFYSIIGCLIVLALCVAAAGLVWGCVFDYTRKWFDRKIAAGIDRELRRMGGQMAAQHYWFQEPDRAAMWLACADVLAKGGWPDASQVRDQTFAEKLAQVKKEREA